MVSLGTSRKHTTPMALPIEQQTTKADAVDAAFESVGIACSYDGQQATTPSK